MPPAPANDVENMTWGWVLATVVVPPSADPQERQAIYTLAEKHTTTKPNKMCNHLTRMVKKTGKAAWCKTHRAVTENAKADTERQNTIEFFKQRTKRCDIESADFMDRYLLEVGLPGARVGSMKRLEMVIKLNGCI